MINQLRKYDDMEMVFIWSGQHYSDNLKSIFFREGSISRRRNSTWAAEATLTPPW